MFKALKNSFIWEYVLVAMSTHTDNDLCDPFAGYLTDGGIKQFGGTPMDNVSVFSPCV
jgi:hypothetical protein